MSCNGYDVGSTGTNTRIGINIHSYCSFDFIVPRSYRGWWHYKMSAGVRPSVCPSVCRALRHNSRTELKPRKAKISRLEAHSTSNQ